MQFVVGRTEGDPPFRWAVFGDAPHAAETIDKMAEAIELRAGGSTISVVSGGYIYACRQGGGSILLELGAEEMSRLSNRLIQ